MQFVPQINKDSAIKELAKKENFLARKKEVNNTELLFLPYYLFIYRIFFKDNHVEETMICVDQVSGECAHLKSFNGSDDYEKQHNTIILIPENEAKERAEKFALSETLYKKRKFAAINQTEIIYKNVFEYPYWVGYFRTRGGIDFNIIDAVTGQKQGPRMKAVFIKYLMQ